MEASMSLRKTLRSQLTKLNNNAKDILSLPVESINNDIIDEVHVMIARIKLTSEKLSDVNEKLMADVQPEQCDSEWEKILEYEDAALATTIRLERWLSRHERDDGAMSRGTPEPATDFPEHGGGQSVTAAAFPAGPSVAEHDQGTGNNLSSRMTVRLPKLDLKQFNGDLNKWAPFWEQFRTVIHENESLDVISKFNYLQTVLVGKAALTIADLVPSETSYNDAIDILRTGYGNSERIIDSYIQKLISLSEVKNRNDVVALRQLYNSTLSITRSLSSLGISANHYGLMVKSIVIKALPYAMRIEFNKYMMSSSNDNISDAESVVSVGDNYEKQIEKLLKFIKVEVESVEHAQSMTNNESRLSKVKVSEYQRPKFKNKNSDNPCSAAGLFAGAKEKCLFCKSENHGLADCDGSQTIKERKEILKQNNRCFRCTKPNHSAKYCKNQYLKCRKCKGRHVLSMCDPDFRALKTENAKATETQTTKSTTLLTANKLNHIYLQTACAFALHDNNNQALIRLIIDGGSQLSFIRECVARQLRLPVVGTHSISVFSFGSSKRSPATTYNRVAVKIKGQFSDDVIEINAIEVPEICFDGISTPTINNSAVKGLKLADSISLQGLQPIKGISMLIGADNYWKLVTGEYIKISSVLTAQNTKLGWTLHGQGETNDCSVNLNAATVLHVQAFESEYNLAHDVKKFWDLESIGVKNEEVSTQQTQDFLLEKIKFKGERYEVTLPWKEKASKLDSNYAGATVRLKRLTSRLIKDSKLSEYDNAMWNYIDSNCAEVSPSNENHNKLYFMPHRPVFREDKETTKLRIVFDASARTPGHSSLNEQLYAGENLVPQLLRVLLNFRTRNVGLVADIEKAFLQIGLDESERDSHSFLWYKRRIDSVTDLPEIVTYRMKRLTFGVTCSPFILAAVIKKHLSEQPPEFKEMCENLLKSFYVDDLVISIDTPMEGKQIYDETKDIMAKASMNIRKWQSNNEELRLFINDNNPATVKILGINWQKATDDLSVDISSILSTCNDNGVITKRTILQTISKIYDPLGLLSPFVVSSKILVQDAWKLKLGWDDSLPRDIADKWRIWCAELPYLNDFSVSRCLVNGNFNRAELHVFADASPQAYGAAAYVRVLYDERVDCKLVIAKGRVAPIKETGQKTLTLPKLELTAALCATRLQKYITENIDLNFDKVLLWSDSKITLNWIKGPHDRWKPYVSNRVKEIQQSSSVIWKYCPGKENPADLLTRGIKAQNLLESSLWKHGPDWLVFSEECWPSDEVLDCADNAVTLAIEVQLPSIAQCVEIFSPKKYSSFEKTLRITAYVRRFVYNMKNPENRIEGVLTTEEIDNAENYWLSCVQNVTYNEEVSALRKGKEIDTRSPILKLSPFLDESGIMRLRGRLQESEFSFDVKHPIILPKSSAIVDLIIWKCHNSTHHGGVNITLREVRKKYWIIQGRQTVKKVISRCVLCKKLKGKPGSEPFAPLPRERIVAANPFQTTGTDFAGPLYVKDNDGSKKKMYIMIFTCAATRAVHLELLRDMSTESCINGLRRFISRRGAPKIIYSDNAKSFKRTSKELDELFQRLKESKVQEVATCSRIRWKFIAERASWWGGWWERLIKNVKNSLKITLGKASLDEENLITILTEVEATVNSRPLTYVSEQPDEYFILSPAHFLLPGTVHQTGLVFEGKCVGRDDLIQGWKARQAIMQKFWKIWSMDYLQQLRSAHNLKRVKGSDFQVGDIVLLHDQNSPRLLWKLARVMRTFPGRDNRTRACEIKLSNGTVTRRPIQLLYPLELDFRPGEDVEKSPLAPNESPVFRQRAADEDQRTQGEVQDRISIVQ